jgi:D-alanyl-D-alanine carboxypeptidase/D-alanyl-D-alanine-endopeptidase (penicillin-binding protein 4)
MGRVMMSLGSVVLALGVGLVACSRPSDQITQMLAWQAAPFFQPPAEPDGVAEDLMAQYLQRLRQRGISETTQGIYLQSGLTRLAVHQGTTPQSAASLTKVATTLAALEEWGLAHRFATTVYGTGPVENGVLRGDLVVEGTGNPFFVWEEAIAVGNALNAQGIRQVTGNLVVVGPFYMNYNTQPQGAGELFRVALNPAQWPQAAQAEYNKMPPGTPKPQVAWQGSVVVASDLPPGTMLLRHQSVNLGNILKQMNIYSNNVMAQVLAESAGGAAVVAQTAAAAAGVPRDEIQLINGSGLGTANRISPRATVAMLQRLEQDLAAQGAGIADVFPVAGRDRQGTMQDRNFPPGTLIKTGTLNGVSALAGVLPTRDRGWVWFAIVNNNGPTVEFRAQQDRFLQDLSQAWGTAPLTAQAAGIADEALGDPLRIQTGAALQP